VLLSLLVIVWSLGRVIKLLEGLTKGIDSLCMFERRKLGMGPD
jgi:hypothetical protein